MIIHTKHGLTDTMTGEIVDLSALARKPKGEPTKRLNKRPKFRTYKDRQLMESVVIVGILSVLVLIAKLAI